MNLITALSRTLPKKVRSVLATFRPMRLRGYCMTSTYHIQFHLTLFRFQTTHCEQGKIRDGGPYRATKRVRAPRARDKALVLVEQHAAIDPVAIMTEIRSIADVRAFEQVSLSERHLPKSTYEALLWGCARNPHKVAIRFFAKGEDYANPQDLTFEELLSGIHRTANLLHSLRVGPLDVVSIVLPNLPQTHFAIWGSEAAGIANPINPLLESSAIRHIMNAAGTKVLIALGPQPGSDIWQKLSRILDEIPTLETVLLVGTTEGNRTNVVPYDALLPEFDATRLVGGRQIWPADIAAMLHTGGTTGMPRLALHTHGNQVFSAWITAQLYECSENDTFLSALPLFHVTGAIVCSLMAYSLGATTVVSSILGYRDPAVIRNLYRIIENYGVSFFVGVPTLYNALLQMPTENTDLRSIRFATCGTAPMPLAVLHAFEKATGITIFEAYGLTEGTCMTSSNPPYGQRRAGSVGLRIPYEEMKIVRLDASGHYERDCRTGEIGVVALRGPNVFAGYKEDRHNRGAWIDRKEIYRGDAGVWLNTGDTGRLDSDEYLWLTGRLKELIIRGGHNIDPASIEGPLSEHPAVALAAAVGRPDGYAGEVAMAYVTLKAGAAVSAADLLAFAQEKIGEKAALPKQIRILEQMPLTAVGKMFKPQLRWWAIEEAYREALAKVRNFAETIFVTVGPDDKHETMVRITMKPTEGSDATEIRQKVGEILGAFSSRYTLELMR
jgi:fatty-acyl-CoA synthase